MSVLGLIGAGAGLLGGLGTLIGGIGSASSSGLSKEDQLELMREQQAMNDESWNKQFTTVSQYNDPSNIARMYKNAGISPAAAFGQGTSAVGQMHANPGGTVTGFPAPYETLSRSNTASIISSIAQAIESVSKLRLNESQRNAINQKLFGEIRAMDNANEWQQLTNGLLAAYGEQKASADLSLVLAKVKESGSATELNSEQALTEQKKQVNIAVDSALKSVEKDLKGKNLDMAKIDLETYRKRRLAELDNIFSDSQRNLAQAYEASAHASELNESAIGKELQNNINKATNIYDIENALFNSSVLQKLQQSNNKEQLFQSLCRSVKESSLYKNSENMQRVDAVLEHFAKMLGIPIAVVASAVKIAK